MLVRGVRRRPEDLRRHGVRQDRDAGDDALPGQAVPVEALLQGGHLRQGLHADAAARPAHRAREQALLSLIRTKIIGTNLHNRG